MKFAGVPNAFGGTPRTPPPPHPPENPCLDKIAVHPHVAAEMEHLRNERVLKLSVTPIYKTDQVSFKLCYLSKCTVVA